MDWKLGVAMSSSSCRSLNSPYVSLQLRIAESGGNIRLQTVEMTIPEFQVSVLFSLSLSLSHSCTHTSAQVTVVYHKGVCLSTKHVGFSYFYCLPAASVVPS